MKQWDKLHSYTEKKAWWIYFIQLCTLVIKLSHIDTICFYTPSTSIFKLHQIKLCVKISRELQYTNSLARVHSVIGLC